MRRTLPTAVLAAGLLGAAPVGWAQAAAPVSPTPISEADKQFLVTDAQGSLYEMSIAALAQQRTTRDDIKAYAAMIIRDHTAESADLQQLAMAKHVAVPTDMTVEDRNKLNGMNLESSSTLDHSFVQEAIRINDEDKKDSQQELNRTSDPDIKAFLQRYAATDAKHEQMAKALQGQ